MNDLTIIEVSSTGLTFCLTREELQAVLDGRKSLADFSPVAVKH